MTRYAPQVGVNEIISGAWLYSAYKYDFNIKT